MGDPRAGRARKRRARKRLAQWERRWLLRAAVMWQIHCDRVFGPLRIDFRPPKFEPEGFQFRIYSTPPLSLPYPITTYYMDGVA